jgi:hypothetical protein
MTKQTLEWTDKRHRLSRIGIIGSTAHTAHGDYQTSREQNYIGCTPRGWSRETYSVMYRSRGSDSWKSIGDGYRRGQNEAEAVAQAHHDAVLRHHTWTVGRSRAIIASIARKRRPPTPPRR